MIVGTGEVPHIFSPSKREELPPLPEIGSDRPYNEIAYIVRRIEVTVYLEAAFGAHISTIRKCERIVLVAAAGTSFAAREESFYLPVDGSLVLKQLNQSLHLGQGEASSHPLLGRLDKVCNTEVLCDDCAVRLA